jgi:hypothetical protein
VTAGNKKRPCRQVSHSARKNCKAHESTSLNGRTRKVLVQGAFMRLHTDKKYSGKKVNAKRDYFPQFFLAILNIVYAL